MQAGTNDVVFTTGAPASHAGELTPPPEPLCAGEVCVVTHLVNQIHLNWRAMVVIHPDPYKRRPPADGGDGRVAVRLLLRPDMRPIRVRAANLFRVHEPDDPLTQLKLAVLIKHGMPNEDGVALKRLFNVNYRAPRAGEKGDRVELT